MRIIFCFISLYSVTPSCSLVALDSQNFQNIVAKKIDNSNHNDIIGGKSLKGSSNNIDTIVAGDGCIQQGVQYKCDYGFYCDFTNAAKNNKNPCFPCQPYHYCDRIYAYKITSTMDLTFTAGQQIMPIVNMYQIYYGDFGSQGDKMKTLIDFFSDNIGNSNYYTTMTNHYYQKINGKVTYASKQVKFGKSISLGTTLTSGDLTTSTVISIIADLISSGKLPNDPNGIYGFIFRGSFNFDDDSAGTKSAWAGSPSLYGEWCGFHSKYTTDQGKSYIKYHVVGDAVTSPLYPNVGCERSEFTSSKASPNNNMQADNIVGTFTHELVETASNFDNAWWWQTPNSINTGYENADICNGDVQPYLRNSTIANVVVGGKQWLLHKNWVPTYGCALVSPLGGISQISNSPLSAPVNAPVKTIYLSSATTVFRASAVVSVSAVVIIIVTTFVL